MEMERDMERETGDRYRENHAVNVVVLMVMLISKIPDICQYA